MSFSLEQYLFANGFSYESSKYISNLLGENVTFRNIKIYKSIKTNCLEVQIMNEVIWFIAREHNGHLFVANYYNAHKNIGFKIEDRRLFMVKTTGSGKYYGLGTEREKVELLYYSNDSLLFYDNINDNNLVQELKKLINLGLEPDGYFIDFSLLNLYDLSIYLLNNFDKITNKKDIKYHKFDYKKLIKRMEQYTDEE